jgi:Holliday junction DNA helicase RuvB
MNLDFYHADDLVKVLIRSARILKVEVDKDAAEAIACRSRGTPRIANKLLKRVRDFAQVKGKGIVDLQITNHSFQSLELDEAGFDEIDRKILLTIIDKFSGGPVGLSTLSTSIQEEKETLEDVYEPFLIQQGFLKITPRGRVATVKAYQHFNREPKDQRSLF